jgi:NitT/TauT family transport system permease protein
VVPPRSWVLTALRHSAIATRLAARVGVVWRRSYRAAAGRPATSGEDRKVWTRRLDWAWMVVVVLLAALALRYIARFVLEGVSLSEVSTAVGLGVVTMARVLVLITLASLIWVPIGVRVGLDARLAQLVQPIAQFMAAFPANLFFPVVVSAIVALRLSPDIWLSPLMILGTQWYILFNVIAGAAALPSELRDIGVNLQVGGWLWWRRVALPGVFPYYVTGAITASGGSWNASIVAEVASWGDRRLEAHGLGAYIARATEAADYHRIVLGIAVMSLFVVIINRAFWRPLYWRAERTFRLG